MNTLTQILTPLFIYLGLVAPAPVIPEFTPRPVEVVEVVEPIVEPVVIIKEVIREVVVEKPVYVEKVVPVVKPIVVPQVIVPEEIEPVEEPVEEPITNEKQERFNETNSKKRREALRAIEGSKGTQFSTREQSIIYTYNRELKKTAERWEVEYEHLLLEESE